MNTRLTYIGCIVVATMVVPAVAPGQAVLTEGDRVRVRMRDGVVHTGTVQSASPQSLRLFDANTGNALVAPTTDIAQISRSLGRKTDFGANFVAAVGISALTFGTISGMAWSPCTPTQFLECIAHPGSRGDAIMLGVLGGAVLGIPVGLIVGATAKSERWERAVLGAPAATAFSLRPIVGKSFGVRGSIAF